MNSQSILFTPIPIGAITIPNRFVRSATQDFMATDEGFITDRQVSLFRNLAEGEVGLIITGHAYVNPEGKASPRQIGIYDDTFIDGLKHLVDEVHRFPSRIFLQIAHAGRQTKEKLCGCTPLAPSSVYEPVFKVNPKEMTTEDIETTILDFIRAAERAKQAAFDGIQLHVAHGYLLSSFISPHTNRRTDAYGGSIEKRLKIVVDIVRGIRSNLGRDYPLIIKLNATDYLPEGLTVEESVAIARILEREGIDGIEVSGGMAEAEKASMWKGPFTEEEEGYFVANASRIKSAVSLPVFGLGGIRTYKVMENILNSGKADLISMCRPFIRDPFLIKKIRAGETEQSECISCNKCLNPRGIRCSEIGA
ncbi:NADH:flavin oxidoreductase [Acidobacteriota bacterium]